MGPWSARTAHHKDYWGDSTTPRAHTARCIVHPHLTPRGEVVAARSRATSKTSKCNAKKKVPAYLRSTYQCDFTEANSIEACRKSEPLKDSGPVPTPPLKPKNTRLGSTLRPEDLACSLKVGRLLTLADQA